MRSCQQFLSVLVQALAILGVSTARVAALPAGFTDVLVATGLLQPTAGGATLKQAWGASGDVSVPGDYDGDGTTDLAIFRKATALWLIRRSSNLTTFSLNWGNTLVGDVPVPADYDGDGRIDIAVYRRSTGQWFIRRSSDGGLTLIP